MNTRRQFLANLGLASLLTQLPGLSLAKTAGDARLVLVILRGALDGLSAVPPYADPDYAAARGELALGAPGTAGGVLRLDPFFGLHPSLPLLHARYQARELIVFHAIASPYRERSHFDAQNVLENGSPQANGTASGWLNRTLTNLPSPSPRKSETGLAVGQNVPLVLRGPAPVASWAPSILPEVDPDLLQRLTDLYAGDPMLAARLADAVAIDSLADGSGMQDGRAARRGNDLQRLKVMAETAGKLLSSADGPRVAVLETNGWDTHAQQGAANGQLATRLQNLDAVLGTLAQNLTTVWSDTTILVVTEFGRTVARNGSRGTDHGTGTCAFLLGGAVAGGKVIADWPGLSTRARYQGRDLAPTRDLRSVFKAVVHDHLQVASTALDTDVFPDSATARPLGDLLRS